MYGPLAPAVAALLATTALTPNPALLLGRHAVTYDRPRVNIWLNREDPYQTGEPARVFFKSNTDAYMTVLRIDTDGRIRVLFPIEPWEDNFARGGRTFEVLGRSQDEAFLVDDAAGVGYVFAISSPDPFYYDQITRGDHWDYRAISDGQVRGDPYVAMTDLAARIAGTNEYDYDVGEYYVEQHYDYPRFVCYDCHGYVSYYSWDPYSSFCSRFRIVIYDDPYYYPYRHYGGRVAVVHPYRPGPRYVFKDFDARDDYVTRVATRPRGDTVRPDDVERSSADVGGRGRVPAPVAPRQRDGDRPGVDDRDRRPIRDGEPVESPRRATPAPPTPTERPRRSDEGRRPSPDDTPDQSRRRAAPAPTQTPVKPDRAPPDARPQKQPSRDRDKDKDAVRSKPSQPKSTGEPELRRRRPS